MQSEQFAFTHKCTYGTPRAYNNGLRLDCSNSSLSILHSYSHQARKIQLQISLTLWFSHIFQITPLANPLYTFDYMSMQFIPLFLTSDYILFSKQNVTSKQHFLCRFGLTTFITVWPSISFKNISQFFCELQLG